MLGRYPGEGAQGLPILWGRVQSRPHTGVCSCRVRDACPGVMGTATGQLTPHTGGGGEGQFQLPGASRGVSFEPAGNGAHCSGGTVAMEEGAWGA